MGTGTLAITLGILEGDPAWRTEHMLWEVLSVKHVNIHFVLLAIKEKRSAPLIQELHMAYISMLLQNEKSLWSEFVRTPHGYCIHFVCRCSIRPRRVCISCDMTTRQQKISPKKSVP